MNNIRRIVIRLISIALMLFTLIMSGIFINEARKEVVYLCGNFTKGVTLASVQRQLDTGTFLHIEKYEVDGNPVFLATSRFTMNYVTCEIIFDENNQVISATSSH
jgi:hypothetical protein